MGLYKLGESQSLLFVVGEMHGLWFVCLQDGSTGSAQHGAFWIPGAAAQSPQLGRPFTEMG